MGNQIISPPAFQRPSGKLYLGSDQLNLVSASMTIVELDTIAAGYADGIENTGTHRITPGVAGFYSIVGQVWFKNVIADKWYGSAILINAATLECETTIHSSYAAAVTALSCTPNLYLTATDYVRLAAWSGAGVDTVDICLGRPRTFLCLQRVR